MITLRQVEQAIAELESRPEPNAATVNKLANLYIIRDKMTGVEERRTPTHSFATAPQSDFLSLVSQIPSDYAWEVMDELMDTLMVVNKRVYDGVMRKLDM